MVRERKFGKLSTACADGVASYCCRDCICYPKIISADTGPSTTAYLCGGTSWIVSECAGDGQTAEVRIRA
jgi:hypothetical protein